MHTHTHTHTHTNTQTHTDTRIYTHRHTHIHTHTWPHLLALGRAETWKMALLEVVRLSRRFLQSAKGISSPLLKLLASTWTGKRVKSSTSTSTNTAPTNNSWTRLATITYMYIHMYSGTWKVHG